MPHVFAQDGLRLHYQVHEADNAHTVALLFHGYGDHCQRYDSLISWLKYLGISVVCFDFRGHGLSEGQRGYISSFNDYLSDAEVMINILERDFDTDHKLLFGHSTGGLVALYMLGQDQEIGYWDAVILSSPFLGLRLHVPLWKIVLARTMNVLFPRFSLKSKGHPDLLSHSQVVVEESRNDPLIVREVSARWFTEIVRVQNNLTLQLGQIKTPSFWQVSGGDQIVDPVRTIDRFQELSSDDKVLKVYEEAYHELWFEAPQWQREAFLDLQSFLTERGLINSTLDEIRLSKL